MIYEGSLFGLITYHRKNMKTIRLSKADEYHLKQRNKKKIYSAY